MTAAGPSGTTRTDARIESTRRSRRSICSSVARCHAARVSREQVGVRADDGERRPQLVGDQGDQLAPRLVDRLECLDPRLGLGLLPALLDDPGQQVGDRAQLGDVMVAEVPGLLGLDVEDPDDLVAPGQRDGQHGGHESALVDAADPQEPRVCPDVRDDRRSPVGRDAAGDALAERNAGPADLEAIQAVGGGEGQVRSVPIEQVERGDVGVEHIASPVDDGLEELVPGPGRRRQAGDLVEEAELFELVGRARRQRRAGTRPVRARPALRAWPIRGGGWPSGVGDGIRQLARARGRVVRRHGDHHTSLRKVAVQNGCGPVAAGTRNGPARVCP